jgi:hypothetical protein
LIVRVPKRLSDDFVTVARSEHEDLAAQLAELQARIEHFEALASEARDEAESIARSIRDLEELLGISSQIAFCEINETLRGERLREVAFDVLRECVREGEAIHYRAWFDALVEAGYRIVGKDPLATFLTHVSRIERVEPVGRRSGLYRLRLAA